MSLSAYLRRHLPIFLTWSSVAEQVGVRGATFWDATPTPLGVKVTVALRPPATATALSNASEKLAAAYGVARVRVASDPLRADRADIYLDAALALPTTDYPYVSLPTHPPLATLEPLPIGLDDNGLEVWLPLLGHGALLGGIPGSGKSNALRVLLAGLAPRRNLLLWGIDPKHAELVLWRERFSRLVLGYDANETIALLADLLDSVRTRAAYLATTGRATLEPSERYPTVVLAIDEWAEIGASGDKRQRQQIDELLRRIVSLGRAVGVTVVIATQRPTSDTIDVTTRSLLGHRFALRCGDRHQADAILGVGTYNPSQLSGSVPGRALWSDGGTAEVVHFYRITDDHIPVLLRQR